MWIHRISGSVVLATTLFYGIYGYLKLRMIKDDVHAPMGLAVTSLVSLVVAGGILARSRLNRAEEGQNSVMVFKKIHQIFGHLLIWVAQITIFFGIYSYATNHKFTTHNHEI